MLMSLLPAMAIQKRRYEMKVNAISRSGSIWAFNSLKKAKESGLIKATATIKENATVKNGVAEFR